MRLLITKNEDILYQTKSGLFSKLYTLYYMYNAIFYAHARAHMFEKKRTGRIVVIPKKNFFSPLKPPRLHP